MKTIFSALVLFALLLSQRTVAQFTLSCDSFCVLSIEMDTMPGFLSVTIQNDNVGHVNYPTVQVFDANGSWVAGDTVFNLFAHMGNSQQTYSVPTTLDSIPDDFMATVILSEGIWDTVCPLPFPCASIIDNVDEKFETNVRIYPVPADNALVVSAGNASFDYSLFDAAGRCVIRGTAIGTGKIDVSELSNGLYWIRMLSGENAVVREIIVQRL